MARSALQTRSGVTAKGPRRGALLAPAASVVGASLLSLLPIVSSAGWGPNAGYLMLIAWRLLRADAWPAWWAVPLGLLNDLITGLPIGQSVLLWPLTMLLLDVAERRTMWRDFWIEWLLAVILIVMDVWIAWRIAAWSGAHVPIGAMLPVALLSIVAFPFAAGLVGLIDGWRLRSTAGAR